MKDSEDVAALLGRQIGYVVLVAIPISTIVILIGLVRFVLWGPWW